MATPARILIVEDEPIIAADLEDRLTEMGYVVTSTVDTGEEALVQVEAQPPDLLLMDIQLAGKLDGVETALKIGLTRTIPLIFLTSNSDEASFTRARAANPRAYISKPFRGRDLGHAIELALERGSTHNTAGDTSGREPATLPDGQSAMLLQDRLFLRVKDRLQRLLLSDIL